MKTYTFLYRSAQVNEKGMALTDLPLALQQVEAGTLTAAINEIGRHSYVEDIVGVTDGRLSDGRRLDAVVKVVNPTFKGTQIRLKGRDV